MNTIEAIDLKNISGACNVSFTIKILIYISMIGSGVWLFFQGGWLYFLGIIVLGLAFSHGVELQHQVLHGGAFTNEKINRITGFLLGAPMLVSYSNYQASHLIHHEKVGTEDDIEFFEFNTLDKDKGLIPKILCFFLISHYIDFFNRTIKSIKRMDINPLFNKNTNRKINNEYIYMFLTIIAACAILAYTNNIEYISIWLLPLLFIAAPIHTLVEFPEHFGCNNESENILENTRSIKASSFMVWYTNGNNYHVEHHMFPLVRPEKLSILHRKMKSEIKHTNHSYSEFFLESI
ncbi:fatty acid desaturase family protein [Photobacterium angustum]|uniref:Fatty acid desaturase domain-containing protein n=1 Tax=Photobacterium angustum TaxID=661 RepID=A0A2S7VKK9_PHOAN|nr:fatty acid desaturase [Photobacterium angustum]PQJ62282.1 hypothetical protein BTO08_18760 [Photobacterium angustum]